MKKAIAAWLVMLALLCHGALAQTPGPAGGHLTPGANAAEYQTGGDPGAVRCNINNPECAFDLRDAKWGLSSTAASIAAGAPDHAGSLHYFQGPVSTNSGSATIWPGCYVGPVYNASASSTIQLWSGNNNLFSSVQTNGGAGGSGPYAIVGQPYYWYVPSGANAGTYTGTLTAYVNSNQVTISNAPATGGVSQSITNQIFCFGPSAQTNASVGQTVIYWTTTAAHHQPNIATISSFGADGYSLVLSATAPDTMQAIFQKVMIATDDSTPLNSVLTAAAARVNSAGQKGDLYLQVNGNYYAPCVNAYINSVFRIGSGSIVQQPPFIASQSCALFDIPVARARDPVNLNFANYLRPDGQLGLSLARNYSLSNLGDSLAVAEGDNQIATFEAMGNLLFKAAYNQRDHTFADTSTDRAIGSNDLGTACRQTTIGTPGWAAAPVTANGTGTTSSPVITVASASGTITVGMAVGTATNGGAQLPLTSTTYVTAVSGSSITLSQNPTATMSSTPLYFEKPWIGNDTQAGYLHDVAPTAISIEGDPNDGYGAFNPLYLPCVVGNVTNGWAAPPSIFFWTGWPWQQMGWSTAQAGPLLSPLDDYGYWGTYITGWARSQGYSVIPVGRLVAMAELGIDPDGLPMRIRTDMPPTIHSEYQLVLPWYAPFYIRDYQATFFIPTSSSGAAGLQSLFVTGSTKNYGGELQFGMGSTHIDTGNVFRLGYDTGTNCLYYKIDGSNAQNIVPQTDIPQFCNLTTDTSAFLDIWIQLANDQVSFAIGTGSNANSINRVDVFKGPVPRLKSRWEPWITSTSGTGVNFDVAAAPIGSTSGDSGFSSDDCCVQAAYLPLLRDLDISGPSGSLPYLNSYGNLTYGIYGTGSSAHHPTSLTIKTVLERLADAQIYAGAPRSPPLPKSVTAAYQMQWMDRQLKVSLGAAATITLPASPQINVPYGIKDAAGNFATYNATIAAGTGCGNIDGASTYPMTVNHGYREFECDGANWQVH